MFFNISFVSAHGKEPVEEIKSETSGDLQTNFNKIGRGTGHHHFHD